MSLPSDYINQYLNQCAAFGFAGGPSFSTNVVSLINGKEKRNALWSQPKHKFTAPFLNISKEAFLSIKDMFLVCRGQARSFKFRDENDYEAYEAQFAVADGIKTKFQLGKTTIIAGQPFFREVYVIDGNIVVKSDNTVVTNFTVDVDRGIITFTEPPAAGSVLRWTGDFSLWVRFASDELNFSLDNPGRTNGSIELIEVQPPPNVT